jgi:hypothetical protein
MVPAGWELPLFTLGLYAFIGVVVGLTVAVIAALLGGNVRPSTVAVDVVVGALGGLVGAMLVGRAYEGVTSYVNGRPVQGGWQAVVVEHEYLAPAALVAVLIVVVHLFVVRHQKVSNAA